MSQNQKAKALINFEKAEIKESKHFPNTYNVKIGKLNIFSYQQKESMKNMIINPDERDKYLSIIESGMQNSIFSYLSAECISKLANKYLRTMWIYMVGEKVESIEFRLNYFTKYESMIPIDFNWRRSYLYFYFTPIQINSKRTFLIETYEQTQQQAWIYEYLATNGSLPGIKFLKADLSGFYIPEDGSKLNGVNRFYCILPENNENFYFKDIMVFDKGIWPVDTSNPCIDVYEEEFDEEDFSEEEQGLVKVLDMLEDLDI